MFAQHRKWIKLLIAFTLVAQLMTLSMVQVFAAATGTDVKITITISDAAHEHRLNNVSVVYKEVWGQNAEDYYYHPDYAYETEETASGWKVEETFTIPMNEEIPVYLSASTDEKLYFIPIDKQQIQAGALAISLDNQDQVPVSFPDPYSGNAYVTTYINASPVDELGKPIMYSPVKGLRSMSPFDYSFQISGQDASHLYMLNKSRQPLQAGQNTITFDTGNTMNVHTRMSDGSYHLKSASTFSTGSVGAWPQAEGQNEFVVTAGAYEDISLIYANDNDSIEMEQRIDPELFVDGATITSDTQLKVNLNVKPSYYPNANLGDRSYNVTDSYGNVVQSIRGFNPWVDVTLTSTYLNTATNEEVIKPNLGLNNPYNATLPSSDGEYTLTLAAPESPIPIQPASAPIVIGTGNSNSGNNYVTLNFPDPNIDGFGGLQIVSKVVWGTGPGQHYYSYSGYSETTVIRNASSTKVQVNQMNWDAPGDKFILFSSRQYAMLIPIANEDRGTTKEISLNGFVPVSYEWPNKTVEGFDFRAGHFNLIDNDGVSIGALSVESGAKVKPGTYNVSAAAQDKENAYVVYKKNEAVSGQGYTFRVNNADLGKLTINQANSNLQLNELNFSVADFYSEYLNITKPKPIYATKMVYRQISAYYVTPDHWEYNYGANNVAVAGDKTIPFNTAFSAHLNWSQRVYEPGSTLSYQDIPTLVDGFGNEVYYIGYREDRSSAGQKLTHHISFKNQATNEKVVDKDVPMKESFQLPENEGTYQFTFTPGASSSFVNTPAPATALVKVGSPPVPKTVVMSKEGEINLAVGQTYSVSAQVTYEDDTSEDITNYADWSSNNEEVATASKGVITAVGEGSTYIFAVVGWSSGGDLVYDWLQVNVGTAEDKPVKSIAITPSKIAARNGDLVDVSVTATYTDGTTSDVTNRIASSDWQISKPIATLENGKLRITGYGTATLSVKYKGKTATASMDTSIKKSYIGLAATDQVTTLDGAVGMEKDLLLRVQFSDSASAEIATEKVQWVSDHPEIVSVDEHSGHIKVLAAGKAKITAVYDKLAPGASITVDATDKTVQTLSANVTKIAGLPSANTVPMVFTAKMSNGASVTVDNADLQWTISDNYTDVIEAVGTGLRITDYVSTKVTASYGGKSVEIAIDTTIKKLSFKQGTKAAASLALKPGSTTALTLWATLNGTGKEVDVTGLADWTLAKNDTDPLQGSLDGSTLQVEGFGKGTVHASLASYYAEIPVTANAKAITLVTTKLTGNINTTLSNVKLSSLTYADSSKATKAELDAITGITFRSSDEAIAAVEENSVIRIVGFGKTNVTASYGGATAIIAVDSAIKSVSALDAANRTTKTIQLHLGQEKNDLKLSVTYADGKTGIINASEATGWTVQKAKVTDPAVVTVDEDGNLIVVGMGKATVKATFGGAALSFDAVVGVTSLNWNGEGKDAKGNLIAKMGSTYAVQINAVFGDGTSVDVTDSELVKWSSSNALIVTRKDGVITPVGGGKANIIADLGGKKVTIPVDLTVKKLEIADGSVKTYTGAPGDQLTIGLKSTGNDGAPVSEESLLQYAVWTTSDARVATVENGGQITIVGPGKATITASYGGQKVTVTIQSTVTKLTALTEGQPEGATINLTLIKGDTTSYQVNALFDKVADPQDVTNKVTITNSKKDVASVLDGVITANVAGKTTITLTYGGKKVTINVTVTP
ncbi:Ig-like domain-containing protein [Paenibacillus sp. NEAU-GSW1]|uniref:Ig-like domain-containing protein n=1 Tax=Paenibacillus sp. NEAU-GSW1 TaxID=2682486 RepID=UPI0012E0D656|nr:Ig-like domain-containing protein [Paenibacillus sp. NEAU-GSW1]MUT67395.1 hypothetical protein [Paenibacillus sp. NEAU-GSW1]